MSEIKTGSGFSIVIPCYNEIGAIEKTIQHLVATISADKNYEIIVVNDGSDDGTAALLEKLENETSNLTVYAHNNNRGYGASLKTGIMRANSEFIVITDADGTYPNERIPELVDLCKKYDMVVGARTAKGVKYSKIRKIPKVFLKAWASFLAGQDIPDINSGLRVFRKNVAERFFGILPDSFSFTLTITLAMLTTYRPVLFVPIVYHQRVGKSKIKPISDTLRFMALVLRTGTYFAPLRAFAPFIMFLLIATATSLSYDIFYLRNLTDKTVILFLFTFNTGMFALLADMIDKRTA